MRVRLLALALVVAAAAGCGGGSKAPSVASLGSAATTTEATTPVTTSFAAFVTCMQAHGVQAQSPGGHGVQIEGGPGDAKIQSAVAACRKLMPGGGPPQLTPAQAAERKNALVKLAACMRKHGVTNFPDDVNPDTMQGIDPSTPVFRTAYKTCWSLYPKVGPQIRLAP